jgi:DNA polymerase III sliding clamp (beta) subunit (PCNA family)
MNESIPPLPWPTIQEAEPPHQVSISQNDLKELLEELERLKKENQELKKDIEHIKLNPKYDRKYSLALHGDRCDGCGKHDDFCRCCGSDCSDEPWY